MCCCAHATPEEPCRLDGVAGKRHKERISMHRLLKALIVTAAVGVASAPTQVHAEGYVTPWLGMNWGSGNTVDNGRGAFGVTAGSIGAGVIGGEFSFGYSPSFFGTHNDFGNNTVIDLMGNLIVG